MMESIRITYDERLLDDQYPNASKEPISISDTSEEVDEIEREQDSISECEYCWYTGKECGAKHCLGVDCTVYRAVTGASLMNGF